MNLLTQNAKAIAAFISGFIFLGLQPIGIMPETPTGETIEIILNALIVAASVWLIPNVKVK